MASGNSDVEKKIEEAIKCIDNLEKILNVDVLKLTAGNFDIMINRLDELGDYLRNLEDEYAKVSTETDTIKTNVSNGNIF